MSTVDTALAPDLINAARAGLEKSYSPYSGLAVGAAVLSTTGHVYVGCNVENASYGLSICAERTAVFKGVSEEGASFKISAIAVVGCRDGERVGISPCGACRQVLIEFATPDSVAIFTLPDGTVKTLALKDLLPHEFSMTGNINDA